MTIAGPTLIDTPRSAPNVSRVNVRLVLRLVSDIVKVARCSKLTVAAALALLGCGGAPGETRAFPSAKAHEVSPVCDGMLGKFVGLPATEPAVSRGASGPTPLAGRWWIRRCATRTRGPELTVRLAGPGWYWVDSEDDRFRLHEQVPLGLDVTLTGRIHVDQAHGILSVWFDPSQQPDVRVRASEEIEVEGQNPWGSMLASVPLSPVPTRVARQISEQASSAFGARLAGGVTVTYDLWRDQSDLALGKLEVGATPSRAFEDGRTWLANDRLRLPSGATHVLGPFEPGLRHHVDVNTQHGPGVRYLAVCKSDMPGYLDAISQGKPGRIPLKTRIDAGALLGNGAHTAELSVHDCPFYLVVFTANEHEETLAALRVRL